MIKIISVVLVAIFLSFLLFALGGWIAKEFTAFGKYASASAAKGQLLDYEETVKEYGDPFEMMRKALMFTNFVIYPCLALLVGAFVGLFTPNHAWKVGFLSLVPFVALILIVNRDMGAFGFATAYLILCCFASNQVFKLKNRFHPQSSLSNRVAGGF